MSSPLALEPPAYLRAGPIRLCLEKRVPVKPGGQLVPFYSFGIYDQHRIRVGHIIFKVGDTRHVILCVGHIGYAIAPEHRGKQYAFFSCQAIGPFVRQFKSAVILTCDPENVASQCVIEKLEAQFLGEIQVPRDDPCYSGGARRKRRYLWQLVPDM